MHAWLILLRLQVSTSVSDDVAEQAKAAPPPPPPAKQSALDRLFRHRPSAQVVSKLSLDQPPEPLQASASQSQPPSDLSHSARQPLEASQDTLSPPLPSISIPGGILSTLSTGPRILSPYELPYSTIPPNIVPWITEAMTCRFHPM